MKFEDFASEAKEKLEGSLSPEVLEKLKACETAEEVTKLMSEYDIELDDDMMETVSGGCDTTTCRNG